MGRGTLAGHVAAAAGHARIKLRRSPLRAPTTLALLLASFGFDGVRGAAQPVSADFHTVSPCRLIDTRQTPGPLGGPALAAAATRAFTVVGRCQIPLAAAALSVNVTVVAPSTAGHLRLFASGTAMPETSTINYAAGLTRANNAIVALGADGGFVVLAHQPSGIAHLVVDVTGYFGTSGCPPAQTPASPELTVGGDPPTLTWPEVHGATSYDLYVRTEPGLCQIVVPVFVTRADWKLPDVTSPYDISGFNKCDTCYHVDAAAVSGDCESPLRSDLGLPAPLGFSLLPCVP